MKTKLIVGTRGSKLALTQTNMVINCLKTIYPELNIETKIIKTTGDKILDKELSKIGGKGLFIKEIEEALLNNEIDFAVHSLKDVPHTMEDGFAIGAVLKREDACDVVILPKDKDLNNFTEVNNVGTGSLRRIVQLKTLYRRLNFKPIRGNIDTRLKKLVSGEYDAIVLAVAGLKRLGWSEVNNDRFFKDIVLDDFSLKVEFLDKNMFIPAVGQGAVAVEIRKDDLQVFEVIKALNDEQDSICVSAERAFLKEINGGCEVPIGAYCICKDEKLYMKGFIADEKLINVFDVEVSGDFHEAEKLGMDLAKRVMYYKNGFGV